MKNKFVYFTQTDAPLMGIQRSYLNILCYTADKLRCTAYYINNSFSDETEYYKNSKAEFLSIEEGNTVDFKDAVILVQPNYLFFMLDAISLPDSAKICLLCGDPYSMKWLCESLDKTNSGYEELCEIIGSDTCQVFGDCPTDTKQKNNITLVDSDSLTVLADKLISSALATNLTAGKIKACKNVKHHLDVYKAFCKENHGSNYQDFFNSLKRKSSAQKKQSANVLGKIKRMTKSVIKKLVPNSIIYPGLYSIQQGYKEKENNVKAIMKQQGKIKVGFIIVFNSVFPCRTVFECMLKSDCFDPYIIVAPNISRSMKFQTDTLNEAFDNLSMQYPGRVISGYDIENDRYLELYDEYNLVFFCNPYKNLVHPFHEIEYFLDKNVLTVYISYGLATLGFWKNVLATDFYNYVWKTTVENKYNYHFQKKHQRIKASNAFIAGYPKMDKLATYPKRKKKRKTIIISPHHTVWGWQALNISNFLRYSEFFIKLPKMYPDIDFIFRPHPLLFSHLKSHGLWTQEQINEYIEKMLKNKNVIYDTDGDYLDKFAYSDAMIHDCGSFIGEYLYTENPCCYLMKSKEQPLNELTPLGEMCIKQHYHAFSENDICNFIESVVIKGNDTIKKDRKAFVNSVLKEKYPDSAEYITEYIKKIIT